MSDACVAAACVKKAGRGGTSWAAGFSRYEAGYFVGAGCTEGHS